VGCGVRQGCLLSPLLFSLFINDLPSELEGGVLIGNIRLKILLYADDIVIITDHPLSLQYNINIIERYCERWNLELNLQKSKIMVFRKGGRLSAREKWHFRGEEIEIVNRYKYLGVILTPRLSFIPHLESRISNAKIGINQLLPTFFVKDGISLGAKMRVFNAICRAIVCYAGQVWGVYSSEVLHKF